MSGPFAYFAKPVPAPPVRNETQLRAWLDNLEQKLENMAVAYNEVSYNKYVGKPTGDLNHFDAAFASLLGEPSYQSIVLDWLPRATDPLLKRRLTLFQRSFLEAEVSKSPAIYELRNQINEKLLTYQPTLGNQKLSRSDIMDILRSSPDRERRRAVYEQAQRPLAEQLEPLVRELMRRRNSEAQRLGYATYADLHLGLIQLNRTELFKLFDELEKLTEATYRNFLEESRQEAGVDKLEVWDLSFMADRRAHLPPYLFPHTQILPQVFQFLRLFGLVPEKLPIQVQVQDIPFGGLCFTLRVPDDIRILSNPKDGYLYYRTMFHEFGHGLHAAFNRQPSYMLKREWGPFNEGMAETLAYFTQQTEWLMAVSNLPRPEVERYRRDNVARRVLRFRSLMAQARFEIEAYSNLDGDLARLNAEIEARYLLTPLNLTPRWAASSFPTTHPIYRQNYILAEMMAAQTHATLRQRFGSFWQLNSATRAALFAFLTENYYAPGAQIEWPEKIARATGQKLSVAALAAELS